MIPVNEPLLNGNEKKYLMECLDTGWISSEGPFVRKFEELFSQKMGQKYGIAVCNGSVALDTALIAAGIKKGDEVIMPTFTIISCATAIIRVGATPVLVDSDPYTWNMDTSKIEEKINFKTKAIMVVHIYGLPVDMGKIVSLADKYSLMIIEDAAEEIGQKYNEKSIGSFGNISCFSFYPNKHITTGEGGMILTSDSLLAEKCRMLRNLCFKPERRFEHDEMGYNFRFTNIQAALGLAQLERLDEFVRIKRKNGNLYNQLLADVKGIQLNLSRTKYAESIYWVYGIILDDNIPYDASVAIQKLEQAGVGTRPFFWPIHEQPVFLKMGLFHGDSYPIAEKIARRGLYLPSGLGLTEKQIYKVVAELRKIL